MEGNLIMIKLEMHYKIINSSFYASLNIKLIWVHKYINNTTLKFLFFSRNYNANVTKLDIVYV